jgi:hypothetical protein
MPYHPSLAPCQNPGGLSPGFHPSFHAPENSIDQGVGGLGESSESKESKSGRKKSSGARLLLLG